MWYEFFAISAQRTEAEIRVELDVKSRFGTYENLCLRLLVELNIPTERSNLSSLTKTKVTLFP